MEEKATFIRGELDRVFRDWSRRTALLGAGIFLALSLLDFLAVPDHAWRFLGLRAAAAGVLVAAAWMVRRASSRAAMHLAVYLAVAVSAAVLEAMILEFGGSRSPYLIGLVLLAVVVAGLVPSGPGFAALCAGTIFALYLVPILLGDEIEDPAHFGVTSVLFLCVLAAGVLVRWFHARHLEREIDLRHELVQSRGRLEEEIARRARDGERLRIFAAAVEGAAEGFYLVDLEGRILYVNPAVEAISGTPPAEYIGKPIASLHADPGVPARVIMPAILRDGRWSGEIAGRSRDGRPLALWLTASLVRDEAGRPVAMVGITSDLADQRRVEEERIRVQRLESIGVLAGGLAHDFNNLLTIILGNIDLARLFAGTIPDAAEALGHASEAALRAGDLTRQLITFSKGGRPVKRVADLRPLVRDTVAFAASGSNVACEFDLPEGLPPVDFDEGQMRQVFLNLVRNACEAMPGGGVLRVAARGVALTTGEAPLLPAGDYLRVDIADQGAGIPGANLPFIFDPYFSTKEMSTAKGRGLGLAVTHSIVRNHGGAVAAESRVGAGTTISIWLPAAPPGSAGEDEDEEGGGSREAGTRPDAAPSPPPPDAPPPVPARGRVLVMDDEPLVLEMAGAALRKLGFEATPCRDGEEAVVRYEIAIDCGRPYGLAILDLTVPGGWGGLETVARLREIDPGVRAALSTGYTDDPVAMRYADAGFAAFIGKPYTIRTLEELLGRFFPTSPT